MFKNNLRILARQLFGKSFEVADLDIVFHKEANYFGAHGYLTASSAEHNVKDENIRFVFPGLSTPPVLTPRILDYIWEEAKAAGFIPTSLVSYGNVLPADSNLPSRALVSAQRRLAEDSTADTKVDNVAALTPAQS
ncbi:hypothetical protein [Ralstonia phage RP31]|uniref:Uncharacterized protein n=2 Tax=Ripduovirus RP12 TaxID=2560700 RepID=A0A1L7N143_9CAUD|nr:hypothetical protein FDH28_gp196 [Ralstonia phage RP12]BAW19199.1 hypothetical protein [Ralstonia phage RP12]BAW19485.1 hypothetical protein [Ralstonia phage RP31]